MCLLRQRNKTDESKSLWKMLAENCVAEEEIIREINNN